ncbi:MAG: FtsQ-type POTRA domain-containing protein [Candidatus Staskawiczbacteria bacterium]|nr:FtsQ-type POTRA domain-containing protein [Candidatus Staskawiczbacteria bacterium]
MASYRKSHIKSTLHKIKPKRSILKRSWFWISLLIFIFIISISYFAIFYSGFQIKNIIILGNEKVKTQDLQSIVSKYAHTGLVNFWNIKITSDSIFLINKNRINNSILEKFLEIEKVIISVKLPQTLNLAVTERKPLGLFCSSDKCFSIDSTGVIFEQVEDITNNILIVRQANTVGDIFTGEKIVAQNIMDLIYKIQKLLKDNYKINLKEALIAGPERLNLKTAENWKIYFDTGVNANVAGQITKLNLLLSGGISEKSRLNLRYIDLRPKDRAIVCDNSTCGG